eukprot:767743-Hanusia_phi.AAC.2
MEDGGWRMEDGGWRTQGMKGGGMGEEDLNDSGQVEVFTVGNASYVDHPRLTEHWSVIEKVHEMGRKVRSCLLHLLPLPIPVGSHLLSSTLPLSSIPGRSPSLALAACWVTFLRC